MAEQRQSMRVTRVSFEKYLKLLVTLLRTFRLLPLYPNATICDKMFDILLILAILGMGQGIVIPNILSLFSDNVNVNVIVESLTISTEFCVFQIKYLILVFRRNQLKELIESCQDLWETNHPCGYEVLSRYVKRGWIITVTFLCVINVTVTCLAVLPFIVKSINQTLPFSPGFVIHSTWMYKMTACFQCFVLYVCAFVVAATDTLLPVLLIISCGQFELMRVILNDINEMYETIKNDVNAIENFEKFVTINLNECIDRHQRLLLHYARIEESFNLFSLVQMYNGLYTIALGLLNLSMGTTDAFKHFTTAVTGIIQVLICNWLPERVLHESDVTNLAIYNLPWYRGKNKSSTTVSLWLMMTQHPVCMTAGKFTVLSMKTFSTVLTNAMSFFTVLQTFT